jgi:GT2 family glycosyltransferase
VESCSRLTCPDFRILIVDNGSTDGSESVLRERFPLVDFIQAGANLGFAGGNNLGIRYALEQGADFVWLLNNDTVVDPEALSELVKVAGRDERVGIVGSKLYYYDEPERIAFAGGEWKLDPLYPRHRGVDQEERGQFSSVEEVDFITGCSLLIKAAVIKDIGEMYDSYFLYWEDIDWNATAGEHGWKILYAPGSRVWHKVSATTNVQPGIKDYYSVRNRLLFLKRHRKALLFPAILRTIAVCVRYGMTGQKRKALLYFNGLKDFALNRFGQMPSIQ